MSLLPEGHFIYRISANSFRGNYSFLNLNLCTVTFGYSTYRCRNYSREDTIQGRKNIRRYTVFHLAPNFEFYLMYCDLWLQYIQVRKLFKGGNYSRAETIRGNTVFKVLCRSLFLFKGQIIASKTQFRPG